MKKFLILPVLLIATLCNAQTIDTSKESGRFGVALNSSLEGVVSAFSIAPNRILLQEQKSSGSGIFHLSIQFQ